MLLTIRQTGPGAEDLPRLLHHPADALTEVPTTFGKALVFYPECAAGSVEAALLLDIDPQSLVHAEMPFLSHQPAIGQFVHPKAYTSGTILALALAAAFPEALAGSPAERPEAVEAGRELHLEISSLPAHCDENQLRQWWELSGYALSLEPIPPDPGDNSEGDSPAYNVRLSGRSSLKDILRWVYALLPVFEREKDYWFGPELLDAVWARTRDWIPGHHHERLEAGYLDQRQIVYQPVLKRLAGDGSPDLETDLAEQAEAAPEAEIGLPEARLGAIMRVLEESGAQSVADLNCGKGDLVEQLLRSPQFGPVIALDVSYRSLEMAARHLNNLDLSPEQTARLQLIPGSPLYRDERLAGHDAVVLAEWMEHLPLNRLPGLEMAVFRYMKPRFAVFTTPNAEYNLRFDTLPPGRKRNPQHRFEWTRREFRTWAEKVADRYGYQFRIDPIGTEDPELGAPGQMAVFTQTAS